MALAKYKTVDARIGTKGYSGRKVMRVYGFLCWFMGSVSFMSQLCFYGDNDFLLVFSCFIHYLGLLFQGVNPFVGASATGNKVDRL